MITYVISAIVVLGVLIIVHEYGHYWMARKMGVLVERFSIGFGREIWKKKVGETEYILAWIPFGGYVKMHGAEDDETLENAGQEESQITYDPQKAYNEKPIWKRLLIIAAGPVANLIFAAILFSFVYMVGIPMPDTKIREVLKDTPAQSIGLMAGDRILEIDGTKIKDWATLSEMIGSSPGKELDLLIERESGEIITKRVIPESKKSKTIFGEDIEVGRIGIAPGEVFTRYNPVTALYMGTLKAWEITYLTLLVIVKIFQNIVPADNIGGPLMIFKIAGEQAQAGIIPLIMFMAVLSVNLGILNFLPIPVLDGGHIVFLLMEALKGSPISVRAREVSQQVGLFLLISLMVFAFYNDISRFLSG